MAQRKQKPSFDAMLKDFIQKYDIVTKKDIKNLERKIDGLAKKSEGKSSASRTAKKKSASDVVLDAIKDKRNGAGLADLKYRTDYDDKKIRNILNRLNKQGKIKRKERGIYVPA